MGVEPIYPDSQSGAATILAYFNMWWNLTELNCDLKIFSLACSTLHTQVPYLPIISRKLLRSVRTTLAL